MGRPGPRSHGPADDPRSWDGLEGPAPDGPLGPLAGSGGRAGARPSRAIPRSWDGPGNPAAAGNDPTIMGRPGPRSHGHADDPRSGDGLGHVPTVTRMIHDQGTAWRVRLLPDLLARSRAREAAQERGPPTGDPMAGAGARPSNGRPSRAGWALPGAPCAAR